MRYLPIIVEATVVCYKSFIAPACALLFYVQTDPALPSSTTHGRTHAPFLAWRSPLRPDSCCYACCSLPTNLHHHPHHRDGILTPSQRRILHCWLSHDTDGGAMNGWNGMTDNTTAVESIFVHEVLHRSVQLFVCGGAHAVRGSGRW